ncbi:MAG: GNAT family N-acetyltransferase [Planctomycetota bacterium]|nr:MAG: GNAT family N-acetyltransferase [Planctomycetota bacterium]
MRRGILRGSVHPTERENPSVDLSLRVATPIDEPALLGLIDSCFERVGRESELARALASGDPHFDPGLSLVGEIDGRAAGYALFLPRRIQLCGTFVKLAVLSPFATLPEARKRGLGNFLLRTGFQALCDRGMCGMVALGPSAFFARHGFAPAFNLYTTEARLADLPEPDAAPWRGLRGDDLGALRALLHASYAGVAGTEERSIAALDWESPIENGHTLVFERGGAPRAYLHFRTRGELEVRECAAATSHDVQALLGFIARLAREHGRTRVDLHLPPQHPVARALFHRGAPQVASNFRGAAMLCITDWNALFGATSAHWLSALRAAGVADASIGIDGETWRLRRADDALVVDRGRVKERHVELPHGLAPGFLTGQRSWRDLDAPTPLARALFPAGTPMWSYSPVFGLADE